MARCFVSVQIQHLLPLFDMTHYDVVIVGGGPAGSTAGTLIEKYNPNLSVLIVEKEKFPRDRVGESQLPQISDVLEEMGCWDKVEAADFPIKIGAPIAGEPIQILGILISLSLNSLKMNSVLLNLRDTDGKLLSKSIEQNMTKFCCATRQKWDA
jgi:Dehydrogenases (flavoproteins)